ncbi:hypothetical protein ACGFKZ_15410 [Micromonospora tulbaghiae]|uniref:hypothetical protein n=1 Tax=Micromonospora TaxID=1873 RepID=UPI000EF5996A|nr:hypothetical protein [Micromonospora sp. BL1]RLQ01392.1 hypothetical protein EAD96_23910 [Micromonospora sp. BL1]
MTAPRENAGRPGLAALVRRAVGAARHRRSAPDVDYTFARRVRDGYAPTSSPVIPDASAELRERVDRLARAGALDEGSAHAFDQTIAGWTTDWSVDAHAEHLARQSVLTQLEENAAAEVERVRQLSDLNARRLAEIERHLEWLFDGADPRRHPLWGAEPPARRPAEPDRPDDRRTP